MTNAEIANFFYEIADILEIKSARGEKGEEIYRINAYRRAADAIAREPRPLAELLKEGKLEEIPGVGKAIAAKIEEIITTGSLQFLERLRQEVPEGITQLLSVPGIGPKTAVAIYERLGIVGIADLEKAAREHRLRGIPGLGAKSEERILEGIEMLMRQTQRIPLGIAWPTAEALLAALREACPRIAKLSAAGSLRRRKETVGDIDVLATAPDPAEVVAAFTHLPMVEEVVSQGTNKSTVMLRGGIQADLMVLEPQYFGSLLQHFTGSKGHNIHLRDVALKLGYHLSEYGLLRDGERLTFEDEEGLYHTLGMEWIPPELREDQGEIEAALEGRLPRLVELGDIKGDLQMHTRWSDGADSIEEMAAAALRRGLKYIAITDHSRGLGIARGLDPERLREQRLEIEAARRRFPELTILHGVEVEIRSDGTLDLPDEELARLDLVIASLHSGLRQEREKVTERLVRAMEHPMVDIVAHPTGRLIGQREGADLDIDRVVEVAGRTGTVLEVNAAPDRLDLRDSHVRLAISRGVKLVIDTDAHHTEALDFMAFGVATARRGWATSKDILNTLEVNSFLASLKRAVFKHS